MFQVFLKCALPEKVNMPPYEFLDGCRITHLADVPSKNKIGSHHSPCHGPAKTTAQGNSTIQYKGDLLHDFITNSARFTYTLEDLCRTMDSFCIQVPGYF